MKTYNIYLKSTKMDFYPPRRVLKVEAKSKIEARKMGKKLKKNQEAIVAVEESNGCDCGQMWCPTCHG